MKEKRKFLQSAALPCVLLALSAVGAFLFYPSRENWIFTDLLTGITDFTFILFYILIATCVANAVTAVLRLKKGDSENPVYSKKAYRITEAVLFVLTSVLSLAGIIYAAGILFSESKEAYICYLAASFSDALLLALVPFCVLFLGLMNTRARKITSALILCIVAVAGITKLFPVTPYKITSVPCVFDTGKNYSIVFSTNDYGTGYAEYTYDGKDYRVYDEDGGRLISDRKIHSINVPYEHLDNNSYKVGSVRVIEQYSYGSRTGAEATSESYTFTPASEKGMTCLVISDWHTYLEKAHKAIEAAGDFDAVILLGDAVPGVDFEQQVINNIVKFAGDVSGGTKPMLYVRGNHETRGEYAGHLLSALGLEQFYYTAEMGGCSFIVLDSGEDKDDSHPEYGGMTDYNTYRSDMIEWLKNVNTENNKVIALSHSRNISDVEKDLSETGWNEIDRLGARLMLSGHEHKCSLVSDGISTEDELLKQHPGIITYIDGGKVGEDYIASKLTVNDTGIVLQAYSTSGEKVFEHEAQW